MDRRAALICFTLLCPATTAHADEPADKVVAARTAFERGATFASEERWGDALEAFSQSASLRPHATTTYNIGYCERALGHATRAKKYFALALVQDQASSELTPDLRAATKKYLDEVRAQLATPRLTIPADAAISIDGRPLEATADGGHWLAGTRTPGPGERVTKQTFVVEIDAGAHELVVSATDGRSKVVHEYFPPGSTKALILELPAASVPVAPLVDHGRARRAWGYAVGALGIVGLGVGTYFGLSARSTWTQAKEACPSRLNCGDAAVRLSTDARTDANVATIAIVAGSAALLGGTILVLTSQSPSSERATASVSAAIDPRGNAWLTVTGSF